MPDRFIMINTFSINNRTFHHLQSTYNTPNHLKEMAARSNFCTAIFNQPYFYSINPMNNNTSATATWPMIGGGGD